MRVLLVNVFAGLVLARERRAAPVREDRQILNTPCFDLCGSGTVCIDNKCNPAPCAGENPCCDEQVRGGCDDPSSGYSFETCVGIIDEYCLSDRWDQQCIDEAKQECGLQCNPIPLTPTTAPSEAPTLNPTASPTRTPTRAPVECFNDVNWASFVGTCDAYSADGPTCAFGDDMTGENLDNCNYCFCNSDTGSGGLTAAQACPVACQTCPAGPDVVPNTCAFTRQGKRDVLKGGRKQRGV